jgi:hypothetical protein
MEGVKMQAEAVNARRSTGGMAAAGWALGALIVAVALSFATDVLFVDVLDAAIDPFTGGAVVPEWVQAVGALITGGAIGGVIGSRVALHPVGVTVATTIVYLLLWPFATLFGSGGLMAAAAVVHLVAAIAAARWFERRAARRAAGSPAGLR